MRTKYKFIVLIILACLSSIAIYYLVDKVKPIEEKKDLLLTQYESELDFLSDTDYTFEEPNVIVNPYGISPLTALIIFETKDLTKYEWSFVVGLSSIVLLAHELIVFFAFN